MVELNLQLNSVFQALSDTTRRSILDRLSTFEMSVGEIAENYKLSLAAISKHIQVLEKAGLVTKRRRGRELVVVIVPANFSAAADAVQRYAGLWGSRFDKLEAIIKN